MKMTASQGLMNEQSVSKSGHADIHFLMLDIEYIQHMYIFVSMCNNY